MSQPPRVTVGRLIVELHRLTRQELDAATRPHGITPTQLGMLRRLAEQPGLSGADMARRFGTSPQAASAALATLESKGLIERLQEPNGRKLVRSSLTETGKEVLAVALDDLWEVERRLLAPFTDEQLETFIELITLYLSHSAAT